MQYDLARKLTNRPAGSPDINPEGLSAADYAKLNLSKEDWELVIELERNGRNRRDVLDIAQGQIKAKTAKPAKKAVAKK